MQEPSDEVRAQALWKQRYYELRHTMQDWHAQAVAAGFDGVSDVLLVTAESTKLLAALNAMLTYFGMDEDEWNRPTFKQAKEAIAEYETARAPGRRAALSSTTVQAGWKLVPVEPTPEMVAAYLTANDAYWRRADMLPEKFGRWRMGTPTEATAESYRAMLAVAPLPAPPAPQQEKGGTS